MDKNVFILCTGRSGSVSFIRACLFIDNYTSGHETLASLTGKARLNYPENHIEADNRLSWFLGRLEEKYGDEPVYVHLIRDKEATVDSFLNRWGVKGSIIQAFENGILIPKTGKKSLEERRLICADYYDTVNANIRLFLKDKSKTMTIRLENIKEDFRQFWQLIRAEGDIDKALEVFDNPSNTSASQKTFQQKLRSRIYQLKVRLKS